MSCFLGISFSSGMESSIVSPPRMKVAVLAMLPFTVMSLFFKAFFSADLVKQASKIPTPYSCSRAGVMLVGTLCCS